jgi:imidazolonepropionase-like amidohydrolase
MKYGWICVATCLTMGLGVPGSDSAAGVPEQPAGLFAVKGARLLTVARGEIARGVLLVENGRLKAVGSEAEVTIPEGARVVDASGAVITPGLIDAHSHLGLGASGGVTEDNEMTDPVTPQLRIIDSIHPEGMAPDLGQFCGALREGVTAVIARPGSGNVIGGQSAVLKLRGRTVDEMVVRFPADMKMALGRKGVYAAKGVMPMTKMGAAYLVRQAMLDAADYKRSLEAAAKKKPGTPEATPPPRDLKKEAMLKVLNREIPVHIHVSQADDIMTAVRLAEEFNFLKLSLGHADEAWKVADKLAEKKVAVVIGPLMIVYDEDNRLVNLARALIEKGVETSIMTDADVVQQPFLRAQASVAVKYGLDPAEALKAITINPARLTGLADRLGTLEAGKDADFVVFDGDPFDLQSRVLKVFIDGVPVFEAAAR